MLGLMQVGMFSSVAAAAPGPLHNNNSQRIAYLDRHDGHDNRDNDWRRQHDEKLKKEKERHEKEMKRYPFESKKHWHERQKHENERHERAIHDLIMEMRHR
nr:hypothetical protein [Sporomusa silvacetica]